METLNFIDIQNLMFTFFFKSKRDIIFVELRATLLNNSPTCLSLDVVITRLDLSLSLSLLITLGATLTLHHVISQNINMNLTSPQT